MVYVTDAATTTVLQENAHSNMKTVSSSPIARNLLVKWTLTLLRFVHVQMGIATSTRGDLQPPLLRRGQQQLLVTET